MIVLADRNLIISYLNKNLFWLESFEIWIFPISSYKMCICTPFLHSNAWFGLVTKALLHTCMPISQILVLISCGCATLFICNFNYFSDEGRPFFLIKIPILILITFMPFLSNCLHLSLNLWIFEIFPLFIPISVSLFLLRSIVSFRIWSWFGSQLNNLILLFLS